MKEYTNSSSIDRLVEDTLKNLKTIVDTNTVFGEPVVTENKTTIIPVSKITVGFVVGGGEYADLSSRRVGNHYPMAGGSGGGISVVPQGFIVDTNSEIRYVSTTTSDNLDKIFDSVSKIVEHIKKKTNKNGETL